MSCMDLGTVRPGSTIRIPLNTYDKDDGSSITVTGYDVNDIIVFKDGSATQRASTAGFTATVDFDGRTGIHFAIIDLADNTTANFWAAGSEYHVDIYAVTVDGVTTGGWAARFRIGYQGAWIDTTIATLSSQTSFTLTSGPAEDDALNGHWAIIHDVASAVQSARVLITDYVGSTKTVTLAAGATFTVTANDNISIMGPAPLQPATLGRTLVVDTSGNVVMGSTATDAIVAASLATSAVNEIRAAMGLVISAVNDGAASTTVFVTDLTEATDDHYLNAAIQFTSGVLTGQCRKISDYNGTTKAITVSAAFTDAPGDNDEFFITGRLTGA